MVKRKGLSFNLYSDDVYCSYGTDNGPLLNDEIAQTIENRANNHKLKNGLEITFNTYEESPIDKNEFLQAYSNTYNSKIVEKKHELSRCLITGTILMLVGIINMKDVFFFRGNKEDFNIKDFLRAPYFTYEYKKTSELLRELKKATNSLAIVLDEYGATAGLLTIEDLIEEIVGEIRDEYDTDEEDAIQKVSDNVYTILGITKLDEINEILELDLESEDYDSIAGHVIHLLDHLPTKGETVTEGACTYKVIAMDKNRIDKIELTIDPDYTEPEEEE